MHFVAIGQRVVAVGKVADFRNRGDVAVHRIDAFERDQLGCLGIVGGEQFFEMRHVVVAIDALFAARIANARDHRGMVERVRIDDRPGQYPGERRECRVVRDIAAGEQQRALLAVKVGEFGL